MSYQVVARRFRPRTFGEVVGQEGVTETLVQGLRSGRIAHAWLFTGPRGVGKTTTARILARALNCEQGPTPDPCGQCEVCRDYLAGRDLDVEEIDGASNRRIEDVRELRERVSYRPVRGSFRVFIIDEVHMLTREAFNALLKTLEEPPGHVIFILATTEPHKVPETIRSRCQSLHFRRLGEEEIARRLAQIAAAEGGALSPEVLAEIAASVRGGMRDAEGILERILVLSRDREEPFSLADLRSLLGRVGSGHALAVAERLLGADLPGLLQDAAEVAQAGLDEAEFLGEVVDALREVLLIRVAGRETHLLDATPEARDRLARLAAGAELAALLAMVRVGLECRARMRGLDEKRVLLELGLLQMARSRELADLGSLLAVAHEGVGARPAAPPPPAAGAAATAGSVAAGAGEGELLAALGKAFPSLQNRLKRARLREAGEGLEILVPGLGDMELAHYQRPMEVARLTELVQEVLGRPRPLRLLPDPGSASRRPRAGGQVPPVSDRVRRVQESIAGQVVEQEQRTLFPEAEEEGRNGTQEESG